MRVLNLFLVSPFVGVGAFDIGAFDAGWSGILSQLWSNPAESHDTVFRLDGETTARGPTTEGGPKAPQETQDRIAQETQSDGRHGCARSLDKLRERPVGGSADDYCSLHRDDETDKCLPGGKWDPIERRCTGYLGQACYQCFEGKVCDNPVEDCTLQSGGGFPLVFLEYWQQHALSGAPCVSTPSDMATNYMFSLGLPASSMIPGMSLTLPGDSSSVGTSFSVATSAQTPSLLILPALDAALRDLHRLSGNVGVEDAFIVPAAGSTQAMAAALFAYGMLYAKGGTTGSTSSGDATEGLPGATVSEPAKAFAQIPYYSHYAYQANATTSSASSGPGGFKTLVWDAHAAAALSDAELNSQNYVELVTYPNNPDNVAREPRLADRRRVIYDCVYNWPQYNNAFPISGAPLMEEVVLFSGSKLSGHAGSRFGWAVVRNRTVAALMESYITAQTLGVSTDTQLRFLAIVRTLNAGASRRRNFEGSTISTISTPTDANADMFSFVTARFKSRWRMLDEMFDAHDASPDFEWVNRKQHGAYVWIRCRKPGKTCVELFADGVGLVGIGGVSFGATVEYVRFSLLAPTVEFNLFVAKLRKIVTPPKRLARETQPGAASGWRSGDAGASESTFFGKHPAVDRVFNAKSTLGEWQPIWT